MNQPACSINLGKTQKRMRLILGITLFALAATASIFFMYFEVPPVIRLGVFFPFFGAMLGFLQAKERTCVVFAYKEVQDLGHGQEMVVDPQASKSLKIKAQKIVMQSAFIAFLLTAVLFFIR